MDSKTRKKATDYGRATQEKLYLHAVRKPNGWTHDEWLTTDSERWVILLLDWERDPDASTRWRVPASLRGEYFESHFEALRWLTKEKVRLQGLRNGGMTREYRIVKTSVVAVKTITIEPVSHSFQECERV